jgi:hypothetical protein
MLDLALDGCDDVQWHRAAVARLISEATGGKHSKVVVTNSQEERK